MTQICIFTYSTDRWNIFMLECMVMKIYNFNAVIYIVKMARNCLHLEQQMLCNYDHITDHSITYSKVTRVNSLEHQKLLIEKRLLKSKALSIF